MEQDRRQPGRRDQCFHRAEDDRQVRRRGHGQERGTPAVQRWCDLHPLGHADPAITARIYSHVLPSGQRASLEAIDGVWTVLDDGRSTNGTYVNDQRIPGPHTAKDGDVVRLGETRVRVQTHKIPSDAHSSSIFGFKDGFRRAKPVILEPIMKVEVVVPEKFMGDITGNLSGKRGQIEAMEDRNELKVIRAKVPLSEMFGYMTGLRSMTEGRAGFTMEFLRYDIVPSNVADTIIAGRK